MEIKATEIKLVPLSEIKLNPKNRNKHPQNQIDRLAKIIKYQGFRRPGTISNRSGFLTAGEGRYLAAKQLGMTHMPVMFQDYKDEDQEFSDGIADNAVDKMAELDFAGINFDLKDLSPDFDLELLGIEKFTLDYSEKLILDETEKEKDESKVTEHECPRCKFKY